MNIFIAILGAILAIFSVVMIHEFGHFIVARCMGVRVLRFSIGFGKPIWSKTTKRGTEFAIAWLPLGGYVRMLGEGDEAPPEDMKTWSYSNKNVFQRMAIVLAGPAMNFIFAIVLYWILFLPGVVHVKPVVGFVKPHSIAARAGLQPMDHIIAINHKPIKNWQAVVLTMIAHIGDKKPLVLTVTHPSTASVRQVTLPIKDWKLNERRPRFLKALGIVPYRPKSSRWPPSMLVRENYSVFSAWKPAIHQMGSLIRLNVIVLGKMILGKMSMRSLGGPISIFKMAGQASQRNYRVYLGFLAFLSVTLGFINLLPIPGLDGGHFFFQLIELVFRRPVPMQVQALCFRIGIVVLIFLILNATFNDLGRIFVKS